jgi:hypothetical protein
VRGTFMSLVSSMQMLFSGIATLVGGFIITRNPAGQVEHFDLVGYLAVAFGLLTIWVAQHLRVVSATQATGAPAAQDKQVV